MSDTKAVQKRRSYTEAEIQRALTEVAACSGNTHQAARNLEEDEQARPVPQPVLWEWSRRRYLDKYEGIRQEMLPAIQAEAAEQHMALARQQMALTAQAGALIATRLPAMDDRDLVNAMGKADIGSGIHTEKAQLLAGLPTQRIEQSSAELLREFEAEGISFEGEVVSEEDVTESASQLGAVPTLHSEPVA